MAMPKYFFCCGFVFLLLMLDSSPSQAKDLAPPGFQWQTCKQAGCSFLVPQGWSFEGEQNRGVQKYQMIPPLHNRKITPLVRVNILQHTEVRTGMSAQRHMELFMGELDRSGKVLEVWNNTSGSLTSTAAMSLHFTRADQAVKKFSLLIRNQKTGTLYVFTFETMPHYWEQDWPVVEQIFTRLRLDEEV